jgi:hypothetical protein
MHSISAVAEESSAATEQIIGLGGFDRQRRATV